MSYYSVPQCERCKGHKSLVTTAPGSLVVLAWVCINCSPSRQTSAINTPTPRRLARMDSRLILGAHDLARDLIDAEEANERLYDNARTEIGRLRDALALATRERDEARAELAAAQDRLTWPRWMEAWDGSFGLVPSDGGPYLAIVCPEDGMWRPWSGIGCNDQRSPGSFDEAEAYLVDLGHIRAGCTIRPCAGGAR